MGIVDSVGNYTIKNNYDTIIYISNSEIKVHKNGKMGIIDFKENIIFPFLYDYVESTDNGFYKKKSSKTYLVNNGCKNCSTDTIGGLWGMAEPNGKLIQPIDAQIIKLYRNYNYINSEFEGSEDSTLIGYIWNRGGEKKQTVISVDTFYNAEAMDVNGNFFVDTIIDKKYSYTIKGGKSGVINTEGKEVIPIKYDDLALTIIRDDQPSIIDKYISQPSKWYKESYFTDDKKPIYFRLGGKTGCLDFKNQIIIPVLYDSLELQGNNVDDSYFNSDSIVTLNIPTLIKVVYVAYLNGNKQYYTTTGKPLGLIEKEVSELPALNFFDNNDKFPFVADYFIASKNAVLDTFYTYSSAMDIDEKGNESIINLYIFFYTSAKGKYNIINPQTHNYMLPTWVDDIIFCPRNLNDSLRFNKSISNLNQQLDFFYSLQADSLFSKKGKFVNFYSSEKHQAYSNSKFSGNDTKSVFCYKQNNQWFLFDIFNNKIINANNGYDSILFNGKHWVATKNNSMDLYSIDGQKQQ